MPRYTFECASCSTRFSKKLKMGEHPAYPCPSCGIEASRFWEGEGFGFDFQEGSTPGNSGVSKHDYPTADQAVGRDSEKRWEQLRARDRVKDRVREVGGHRALQRRHVIENGQTCIEYQAAGEKLLEARRKLVKAADNAYKSQREGP